VKIGIECSFVEETSVGSVNTLVNWVNSKTAHPKGLRSAAKPSNARLEKFPPEGDSVEEELHPEE